MERVNEAEGTVEKRRRALATLDVPSGMRLEVTLGLPSGGTVVEACVDRLTHDTVVATFESGVDALAAAMTPRLMVTFRTDDLDITVPARPGRRIDDVADSRTVELVLLDA